MLGISGFGEQAEPNLTCLYQHVSEPKSVSGKWFLQVKNKGMFKYKFKAGGRHLGPTAPFPLTVLSPFTLRLTSHVHFSPLLTDCYVLVLSIAVEVKRAGKCSSCPVGVYHSGHLSGTWRNGGEQIGSQ